MGKRIRFLLGVLLSVASSFAFEDSDLDGVEDSKDRCPNTPILVLVDKYGCPLKEELKGKTRLYRGRFYLRIGGGFVKDESEERSYTSLSLAYSYKLLYTSLSLRYYTSSKLYSSGWGDASVFAGISKFITEKLYTLSGLRIKFPTGSDQYSSGKTYYTPSVVLDYIFGKYDVFTYVSYTFRNDDRLKDTFFISVGGGADVTKKLYLSLSYDISESALEDRYDSYVSLFSIYDLSKRFYISFNYSKGINDEATDHSVSARLGIRF